MSSFPFCFFYHEGPGRTWCLLNSQQINSSTFISFFSKTLDLHFEVFHVCKLRVDQKVEALFRGVLTLCVCLWRLLKTDLMPVCLLLNKTNPSVSLSAERRAGNPWEIWHRTAPISVSTSALILANQKKTKTNTIHLPCSLTPSCADNKDSPFPLYLACKHTLKDAVLRLDEHLWSDSVPKIGFLNATPLTMGLLSLPVIAQLHGDGCLDTAAKTSLLWCQSHDPRDTEPCFVHEFKYVLLQTNSSLCN